MLYVLAVCISLTAPSRISTVSLTKTMLERYKPSLTVTWTKPQSDVGISNYQVEYRKSEDTHWIPGPTLSRSMTFTNLPALTANTVYSVRVRAGSAVGDGNWSKVETERTYKCEWITIICCFQNTSSKSYCRNCVLTKIIYYWFIH